jgi:hypothetical protein
MKLFHRECFECEQTLPLSAFREIVTLLRRPPGDSDDDE